MADASRYFYDERYRGRSLLNRLPHGWRESLDQTLSDLCTRGDHPESSWDEYSQELLLSLRADVRDAYLTRHIKFPFYRVAGEEDFWRCLRTQSPFIEQLAREYPHLGVEVLEQLWLERGRGMPSALPSPAEKNGNWLSTNEMSPGFPALATGEGPYAAVIITPRCGIGGSEKVMREMISSIERLTGQPSLLIVADTAVATEDLPRGAICLPNLSLRGEPFLRAGTKDRVAALGNLILQVDAPRAITINSFAGNTLFLDGTLQSRGIKVASAVFSEAVGPGGAIEGYVQIADWLIDAGVTLFSDNKHIARMLSSHSFYDDTVVLSAPAEVSDEPPPQGPRILWAGRIGLEKRPDLLLEIARASPDLVYELWGVPLMSDERVMAAILAQPNIHFRGAFDGVASIEKSEVGCLLYTSAWDGTPNLLLEAMACGLACVSTAVGGIPDLLANGRGVLIAPDAPAQVYVDALRMVLGDRVAREAIVERCQAYIREKRTRDIFDRTVAQLLARL